MSHSHNKNHHETHHGEKHDHDAIHPPKGWRLNPPAAAYAKEQCRELYKKYENSVMSGKEESAVKEWKGFLECVAHNAHLFELKQ